MISAVQPRLATCPETNRERFNHRSFLVGHGIWKGIGKVSRNSDIINKGTINGGSTKETDIGAQIVMSSTALLTVTVRDARLNRHALTDPTLIHICPNSHNH